MAEDERIKDIICSDQDPDDSAITTDSAYMKPSFVRNSAKIHFNMKQKELDEELLESNFAYQYGNDKTFLQRLGLCPKSKVKAKPIHQFDIEVKQPGDQWRVDRNLLACANPNYARVEKEYFDRDKMFLNKRRQGSLLKNLALDQDLKIKNKKTDAELRNKIF